MGENTTETASASPTPGRLAGRVAIVTGGARNLGQAQALRLAGDGADVAILDAVFPAETVEAVRALGVRAIGVVVDLRDPDAVGAAVAEVAEKLGPVAVLVNNAGIYPLQPLEGMTYEQWREVFRINVDAVFLTTQACAPHMKELGWGRIVNITSNSVGLVIPALSHYIASKMAVIGFTRASATELAEFGITVNAVGPSLTRTPVATSPDELFEIVPQMQAIKRPGLPADLVGAVSFLASDDAAFLTGQTLWVDGGLLR
ncbi:SDR family NAD(P)-dependent oxidoreductase [Microbacterium sp. RD1]|uniref:SDR family NAD(P)-dependent oxidoreductase n=1 Tax=Microbacterium sp. RD1 TaxID=3457313 RepID=UPI003FA5B477